LPESKGGPRVSAVVLNYLNYEQTLLCVADLLAQDWPQLDVVVVDNQSPNESMSKLREAYAGQERVTVLQTHGNLGYARGNNHGARWRTEQGPVDYILVSNNDVRLPARSTVREMVAFAETRLDLGGLGPRVETPNGFPQGPYRRPNVVLRTLRNLLPVFPLVYRFWRRSRPDTDATRCYAIVGAFMLIKAKPFAAVDFFDEGTFLGAEEYILAERLRRLGLTFWYLPSTTVIHDHRHSSTARTGGKTRYSPAGAASMLYYFRTYQKVNSGLLRCFELSARFYNEVFLGLRRRFTI